MSLESSSEFAALSLEPEEAAVTFEATGLPEPHPAEADTFARHEDVPGHNQEALSAARVIFVGAGGLNSWNALGMVRSGLRFLTIIDPDIVERTNLTRQLYYGDDLAKPKATSLARNLLPHMTADGTVTGLAMGFEEAALEYPLACDLLVVGVDNNACRLASTRFAKQHGIPAIFSMLSLDGMRTQCFLQGPGGVDACLWCALPNLDPETAAPCAAAVITSCFLASSFTLFFAHRAFMGWPDGVERFNWQEADLLGTAPDHRGLVPRRPDCRVCGT